MSRAPAVIFLGPSLPAREARRLFPGALLPGPARQGDVLRALRERPRVLALVDGVFETQRSVWHQELRIALSQGVAVLGASSMGALRAVELAPFGMTGIGEVYRAYAAGSLVDDADVALLHADAQHGWRALTVPLVNVMAAADRAAAAGVLAPAQARSLVRAGRAVPFDERDWSEVLARVRWPRDAARRFQAFLLETPCDVKAEDARECIAAARALCRRAREPARGSPSSLSAWALRAWMQAQGEPPGGDARRGLATLLLAEWGRSAGLAPEPARVARFERGAAVPGLDEGLRRRWAEALALEEQLLDRPQQLLAQAPSPDEGRWVDAVRQGAARTRQPATRSGRR